MKYQCGVNTLQVSATKPVVLQLKLLCHILASLLGNELLDGNGKHQDCESNRNAGNPC
jgi:hypothetical protein